MDGLTAKRIFQHDLSFIQKMIEGAQELEREGVQAITGDCGFMAIYHEEVKKAVHIPVFLSSLLQIPFIQSTLAEHAKIGILTANGESLTSDLFAKIGIHDDSRLMIRGLENEKNFKDAVIDEIGTLDSDGIRQEAVQAAKDLISAYPEVRAILMECSMLPPYSEAVQRATKLPVYDFLTMIDFVYSSLNKKRFADVL